jgi:penicillin-insensitive murein DD-endopeptidase
MNRTLQLKVWKLLRLLCLSLLFPLISNAAPSQCYGKVSNGRIEGSVKLPLSGPNFSSYSDIASAAGRTYVHSSVKLVVETAFAAAKKTLPNTVYVYGETGLEVGGKFRPHKTHQNGTSVDFFVPVKNARGDSVPLPIAVTNKLGYNIEFDSKGRYGEYSIDFPALAEHLYQLHLASKANGFGIALVIFDPVYFPSLFATPRGAYLKKNLPFMKGKPWVRHDEHYHVDFAIACKPNL